MLKAIDLLSNDHQMDQSLITNDLFDKIVADNSLMSKGQLCEVCGPPGVGKTQFLLKMCSFNQMNSKKNANTATIYIDSENSFNARRFFI